MDIKNIEIRFRKLEYDINIMKTLMIDIQNILIKIDNKLPEVSKGYLYGEYINYKNVLPT